MQSKKDLTQGNIIPHIVRMALPMFLGLVAHMVLNIADAMYVSRLGTQASMAVLNYGFPMFYVPFALFNGLNSGSSAILAQLLGAKKVKEAEQTLAQTVLTALGVFVVLIILIPFILKFYLAGLKVDPITSGLTQSYVLIVMIGFMFTSSALVLGGALRAEGNMRTLSMAMFYGTILNLILDPLFIFDSFKFLGMNIQGLGWGVPGAAIATVVANFTMSLVIVMYFLKGKSALKWPILPSWSDTQHLKSIIRVSLPASVSQSMFGVGVTLLTALATPFGSSAIAALGIGMRIDTIGVFTSLSIMSAIVSLVGQNYGAQNIERVRESIVKGLLSVFICASLVGVILFLLKGPLLGLFNPEKQTLVSAIHYLSCVSLSYGFIGMAMVAGGAFQGLGRGTPSMYITILRIAVVNFALSYILSKHTTLGEYGLHYAPMLTNMLMGSIATIWILTASKKSVPNAA